MTSSINYLGTTLGLIALATLLSQVDAGRAKINPDQIAVSRLLRQRPQTSLIGIPSNDGNTVKAYLKDNKDIPSIIFPDNTVGSEHLLDGIAAPLEVQLVHFNSTNAKTFEEALAKKETILVLGALFDIIPCSVTAFEPLINTLEDVVSPGSEAEVTGLKLEDLLPTDKNTFFTYQGSLTMPRCEEGVKWFVFK
ncbi:Carbonic anhydrase 6, partial [Caligus rogercresseyi]